MKKQNNHILVIISTIFICIFTLLINSACSSHLVDITSNNIPTGGIQSVPETTNDTPENTPETPEDTPENPGETEETPENPQQPQPQPPLPPQPQARSYFSLESDPRGIKLILDDDVTLQENAGSAMYIEGVPIKISNMDWTKKEFIFPFVTQGQTYSIELAANIIIDDGSASGTRKSIGNTLECEAGGGIDYTQYINPATLENIQIDVNYDGSSLIVDFMAPAGTVFINSTPISNPRFDVDLWKGKKDWSHTTFLGYAYYPIANVLDNSNRSATITFPQPDLSDWASYEYKYWARIYPHFNFDGFGNTQFEIIPGAVTAEKTYNP